MKKVRIITFCTWKSIGSILQSYALSKTLKSYGYENTVWLEHQNFNSRKNHQSFKEYVKKIYRILKTKKVRIARQKRQDFILKNIQVEYFSNYETLKQKAHDNKDDVFLAGSDQIWHPDKCSPLFFLDFIDDARRISYAASMGKTEMSEEKEEKIAKMILPFEKISVREYACAKALQKITSQEIYVHIDPTFLITPESWRKLEKKRNIKEPYVLLYMLYWDSKCKKQIIDLKKRTGLPVYAICSDVSRIYADKYLFDVGVEEFLWLIDHAKYVITSSFHGVAFSIIFRKKFSAIINPDLPSRIENIFEVLSVPLIPIDGLDRTEPFNYDVIFGKIENERQRSIAYLKEAIG